MSDDRCPRCGGPLVAEQIAVPGSPSDPQPWPTIAGELRCARRCGGSGSGRADRMGDYVSRLEVGYIEDGERAARREAEMHLLLAPLAAIVRDLAACDAPTDEGLWCQLCDPDRTSTSLGQLDTDMDAHAESCPWRRAREWTEAHP